MSRRLEAVTEPGRAALVLAEGHATVFAAEAATWDQRGRFPLGHVRSLQTSGLSAATAPCELGGGGVEKLRDVMAITSRVAYGDASLGIALSMHLSFSWSLARAWRAGNEALGPLLAANAAGLVWFCSGVTESGTNYFHPKTTLSPTSRGWHLTGHKVFATGSPAATHFNVGARLDDRLATVIVPANTVGIEVRENWDGLGMRASGSGELIFADATLGPDTIVIPGPPWGQLSPTALTGRAFGNVGNLAAMLGIAETARDEAASRVRSESRVSATPLAHRHTTRHHLAELDVELATARAVLACLGQEADERADAPPTEPSDALAFMASYQEAKLVLHRCSTAVVGRALDLSGGSSYRNDHAQARHYRDIRAGAFMQPFSPHEALGFIGAVAAGIEPDSEA